MNSLKLKLMGGLLMAALFARAQKPPIDTSVYRNWPVISSYSFAPDGKHFFYTLSSVSQGSQLILSKLGGNPAPPVRFSGTPIFTSDSRYLIYRDSAAHVVWRNLRTNQQTTGAQVSRYVLRNTNGRQYLISQNEAGTLEVYEAPGKNPARLDSVRDWQMLPGSSLMLAVVTEKKGETLRILDITTGENRQVWKGLRIEQLSLSANRRLFAFLAKTTGPENQFFYYNGGYIHRAKVPGSEIFSVGAISGFSQNGRYCYLQSAIPPATSRKGPDAEVTIWNKETFSFTIGAGKQLPAAKLARLDLSSGLVNLLGKEKESLTLFLNTKADQLILLRDRLRGNVLLNMVTGQQRNVLIGRQSEPSPAGRYLIEIDRDSWQFKCYDIRSGKLYAPGADLPSAPTRYPGDSTARELHVAGWLNNDQALLLSDNYDLWRIDPSGRKPPVNITANFGYSNGIHFNISGQALYEGVIKAEETNTLILSATSERTRECGFYRARLDRSSVPEKLIMQPVTFSSLGFALMYNHASDDGNNRIGYLVQRSDIGNSANLYYTRDFRDFRQETFNQPESHYNWITSELLNFHTLDGRIAQAALYKPQNFDPQKKYPLIVYYYDQMAQEVYNYHEPFPGNGGPDIVWLVSHGYFVCTPDMDRKPGNPGPNTVNVVGGLLSELKKRNYVDTLHIGAAGHSFGGYRTNFLISHTNWFAAAYSGAGTSDMLSSYNSLRGSKMPNNIMYEIGQYGMVRTPWDNPSGYIANSPIYNANQVQTPLLLMNNPNDPAVAFSQGVEFYLALARLRKPVWLLQYAGEGHTIDRHEHQMDFTLKLGEFFDYYLKGAQKPAWMDIN